MTPRDVDQLSEPEYRALVKFANADINEQKRAARAARRRR